MANETKNLQWCPVNLTYGIPFDMRTFDCFIIITTATHWELWQVRNWGHTRELRDTDLPRWVVEPQITPYLSGMCSPVSWVFQSLGLMISEAVWRGWRCENLLFRYPPQDWLRIVCGMIANVKSTACSRILTVSAGKHYGDNTTLINNRWLHFLNYLSIWRDRRSLPIPLLVSEKLSDDVSIIDDLLAV